MAAVVIYGTDWLWIPCQQGSALTLSRGLGDSLKFLWNILRNVCFMWIFYEDFFMHMHLFCFKALQKTDFFKVVFVEKMSFLQKNSIWPNPMRPPKSYWLARSNFLCSLPHVSLWPLLLLMALAVPSPTWHWLMPLGQEWHSLVWVRWCDVKTPACTPAGKAAPCTTTLALILMLI